MDKIRKIFERMPGWVLTVICLAAILWLTLAAKPLGDNDLPLFPGADKIAHGIMFGGFTFCILLDWTRKREWRKIPLGVAATAVATAVALGVGTELAQDAMGIGRSGDSLDLLADTTGAAAVALIWINIGRNSWRIKKF